MEAKDRTEQAKEIIAMVQAGELGYEDMQIYIDPTFSRLQYHIDKIKKITISPKASHP